MGKGSAPRPIPDRDKYASNFDAIFGKKKDKEVSTDDKKGRTPWRQLHVDLSNGKATHQAPKE
jgi:hypothetical protein